MWSDDMSVDEFGDAVVEVSNREFSGFTFMEVGDPSGKTRKDTDESSCQMILRGKRRHVRSAPTNNIIPRLEAVKRLLSRSSKGKPKVLIDPRCRRLIDGFSGGYRYVERGSTGSFADTPEKNSYSHVHDAFQYLCLDVFGYAERDMVAMMAPLEQRGIVNA